MAELGPVTYENGTDEAAFTAATAVTGAGLSDIQPKPSSNMKFDNAHPARGLMGARHTYPGGAAASDYQVLTQPAPVDRLVAAVDVYMEAYPTTAQDGLLTPRGAASGVGCLLYVSTAGRVLVSNAAGTNLAAAQSPVLALNTHYWVCVAVTRGTSTTTGTIELSIINRGTGEVIHTWSTSATNTGTGQYQACRLGRNASQTAGWSVWFDDYTTSDRSTGLIAPPSGNAAPTANAGVDQTVEAGSSVTLTGTDSDSDGTIGSRVWSLDGSQVGSGSTHTFTAPVGLTETTRTYTYTVTDNAGASTSDTVVVTIRKALISMKNPDGSFTPLVSRLIT